MRVNKPKDAWIDIFDKGLDVLQRQRSVRNGGIRQDADGKWRRVSDELPGVQLRCERGGKWFFTGCSNNGMYKSNLMCLYHDWMKEHTPCTTMTVCGHNFCFQVCDGKVIDLSNPMYDEDQPILQELFVSKWCETYGMSKDEIYALGAASK